jgi:soluble lytic murein transglycosylase-like protein
MAAALTGTLLACGLLLGPTQARADLYKYRDNDGSMLITTEARPDLELIEVVSGTPPSAGSSNSSDSANSSSETDDSETEAVRRARRAKRRHERKNSNDLSNNSASETPRRDQFDDLISEAAAEYNVPFSFVKAVIRVESDFTADAVSHAGAMGLMQLMPNTADYLNVTEPFDPRQNIFGGTKLIRLLIDRYDGDINLILSAYNAGDAAVSEYDGIPYEKTRQYVASVYHWYKYYRRSNQTDEDGE